ncbi:hypothetical protein HUO13_12560 [Saccharopolyspora erythraea]|uniref:hypothetical protein n=1 Tax=Saccharopolyspora erythraea TaxID=1836 RepID=UPI001BA9BA67|nr:hypothetical protein [Saccharopolyspora erythraea]QUH01531.1 hypothetical protein HUO13_12560 [Saccharopolyspora erythraea]
MTMLLMPPSREEEPHLAALKRSVESGFRVRHFGACDGRTVTAIYAERWCAYGVVDSYTLRAMTEAVAARVRIEDYPHGDPLWETTGTVADVITALLELPPHGHPGAPGQARRPSTAFWLPGLR